jgi:flagellin
MTDILSFKDNLNRADGSPGSNWAVQTGSWNIQNGQLVQSTTGTGDKVILAQGPKSDNFDINADAKFLDSDSNANIGIIIKGSDFNNEVFGWYNKSGGLYIGERSGGNFKSIAAAVYSPPSINTNYKLSEL